MTAETPSLTSPQAQRILRLYHLYRLTIGVVLVLLISSSLETELLQLANPNLFRSGCWLYLVFNILVVVLLERPSRQAQLFGLAMTDAIMLSGLFYAAGGPSSGIGNLLIASVAISNVLLRGRIGLLIAAVSAIGIIYLTFYISFGTPSVSNDYVQAGSLGALCFAAALLVQALTARLQVSEGLAEQRAADVDSLEELNALILQRMRTGIVVLDARRQVVLANQGALTLLGHERLVGQVIDAYSPQLVERLRQWLINPIMVPRSITTSSIGPVLQPSFAALNRGDQRQTLIFLEDLSQIAHQAQQLKLAALGRLTAGIAHEIRNPLGAVSHAAQLLNESEDLSAPDRRLGQIIHDQSQRIDRVIENVLQLSRRREAQPELLDLKVWLENFVSDFRSSAAADQSIHVQISPGMLTTRMDAGQLTQIITNLVQNGLRYSRRNHPSAQVWLNLHHDRESDLPILEVLDDGPGVSEQHLSKIFEPFFTTESKGTGLGLYLSRELCESNQAHLEYIPRPHDGGSCLRITFAHPFKTS
ncbi:Sensor protein PilS [Pseudomonas syringae pv. antirrhini]|uniref:histidine kinase n=1 Tax=Pseudomonas syringae pv. antirrhini TaxID=251702 RepID=A0A0P9NM19_9PSED|nr:MULTISPECIES: ATP-binding protein [Pseudomonas]KPW44681.1 Type IV pilus sensor protein PilS [Pseudomonas syringae pv. antirrhini]RMP33739.1 Sensor protein PilS [Pseudomonas syringae pv. antirrhini]RMP41417.1 Sensor protein PilS [Pseudomonas syringae pv. antirrhini]RMW30814.1 Sensor protein PilS [Pseudomonas syringae pv. antirrhini]WIN07943.1 ATP-binding protein [Pseudomonas syringae pv. antirrhini str. 126]